jgi:REP element-mobilizing transposase RayT
MPRAHRHYIPGCAWHITHRCHKQEFLLSFEKDRKRWRHWLFEAKKRYGLCVLNYIVTSNHVHLLVVDTEKDVIAKSLQLVAGRTAQEFNQRKKRKGAFWEDRYHATAVETDEHLAKCIVYIDLNMVRAGVVKHPSQYRLSGFNEIQNPPKRYTVIDRKALMDLFSINNQERFRQEHRHWVEAELQADVKKRKSLWSESIAIGSEGFIEKIQQQLGLRGKGRSVVSEKEGIALREVSAPYITLFEGKKCTLRPDNSYFIDLNANNSS